MDTPLYAAKARHLRLGEIELKRIGAIPIIRYRYRGSKIPNPWVMQPT